MFTQNETTRFFGLPQVTESCPKLYRDGPPRAVDPAQTLKRIRPYFEQAGLTRLSNLSGLDRHDLFVTGAYRPNSKSMAVSSGKSLTLEGALVSGAMESLELWAAENMVPELTTCPWNSLEMNRIPLELLPLRPHGLFSPRRNEVWCAGWDLMNHKTVAVPFQFVTMDLCFSEFDGTMASFRADSNGLASGSSTLEAISSALYEVVERDAVTLWDFAAEKGGLPPARVNLDPTGFPRIDELVARIRASGIDVYLFDCTSDTEVPVYSAYCADQEVPRMVAMGYGAHLDPLVAAERALIEAIQGRTVMVAGAREDIYRYHYEMRCLSNAREFNRYIEFNQPRVELSRHRSQASETFEGDIQLTLDLLRKVGLEQALVVDLTPPGWDISVVRLLVPGLQGYHLFDSFGQRAARFIAQLNEQGLQPVAASTSGVQHFPAGGLQ